MRHLFFGEILIFHFFLDLCRGATNTPRARQDHAAALVNGSVYVFGGISSDGGLLNDLCAYDGEWRMVGAGSTLPSPRRLAGAAAVHGAFYVFGGLDVDGARNDLFVFDGLGWSSPVTTGDLPAPRMAAAVASFENLIYVFGGLDDVGRSRNDLSIFNTTTAVWTSLSRVEEEGPSPRSHSPFATPISAAGEATGFFYLHGGRAGDLVLRDTWALDVRLGRWILLSAVGPARAQHALIVTSLYESGREEAQRLLLLGGVDQRQDLLHFDKQFDFLLDFGKKNAWREISDFPPRLAEFPPGSSYTPLLDDGRLVLQFGGGRGTAPLLVVHKCCLESSGAVFAVV